MSNEHKHIDLSLDVTLCMSFKDNKGIERSQLTVNRTPRILYDFIPLEDEVIIPSMNLFGKSIEFKFKRKIYVLEFERIKEAGEP